MLYKYVGMARKSILEDGLIRFSQPSVFNDPFDLNPKFSLMDDEDFNHDGQRSSADMEFRNTARPDAINQMLQTMALGIQAEISKFAGSPGTYALRPNDIARSTLDATYGVLCLTESPENLLMWAHYCDSHRGFVLQLDESHEFFSKKKYGEAEIGLTKVEYTNTRPSLTHRSIQSPSVLYRKSLEWAYESEWRLVRPLAQANEAIPAEPFPIALFQIPFEAIQGIIIGVGVSHEERVELFKQLESPEKKHITIYQVRLSDDDYELEIHPRLDGKVDPGALSGKVLPPNINLMITIE